MSAALRMGRREWVLLVLLSVLWGGAFFFSAVAVKQVEPFTLAFLRMAIAAVALGAIAALTGASLPKQRRLLMELAFMGVVGTAMPFSLIFLGQTEISGGLASILNATTPLFTIVIAHFFTRDEKFTPRRLAGVIAGFAGVAVIVGPSAFQGASEAALPAQAAVLGAAICYATAGVFGKRFRDLPPVALACGQLAFGALAILPAMLIFDAPLSRPTPDAIAILSVLGLALLSTALAFIIFFQLLAAAGATNVMLVTLLIPVSAILLGVLILGETLGMRHLAGLLLVAAGLAVIDGRLVHSLENRLGRARNNGDASSLPPRPMLKDTQNL